MVVLATGGYGNVFYLSTNAKGCNVTATWRSHRRGALFANPCYTQIHPTCIPQSGDYQSKLTLMSESLRNDGRVWVPKNAADCSKDPAQIPGAERDYYLERHVPELRQPGAARHRVAPRQGHVRPRAAASAPRSRRAARRVPGLRRRHQAPGPGKVVAERYGNLFQMYERITGEDPYKVPMRIYPAIHYTMGGLWVDYNLQSTIPGLFVGGEANFSDHGANRLGASALMQGLADGYFVLARHGRQLPGLAEGRRRRRDTHPGGAADASREVEARINQLLVDQGQAHARLVPPRARRAGLGQLRHGAHRGRA